MSIINSWRDLYSQSLLPLQATLELTYRCNERCGHCYLATFDDRADGRPPLSLDEWKYVVDQLADAKALYLILIGGEAMMHPQFWGIAEHGAKRNFAMSLITNGLLIDEPAAEKIAELGFYQATISLYSADATIHDRMTRRPGSHARTLAAIGRLKNAGVKIGLNCLLTKENIDTCFDLKGWAEAMGFPIGFDPLVTAKSDSTLGSTATRATVDQLRRYYTKLQAKGQGPTPNPVDDPGSAVCNAGRGKCAVNPYGDLLTCLEVREPIGNLREKTFQELWHSPQAEKLRGYRIRDLKFDPTCGNGSFCDHCPGMAGSETGDRMAPVPFLMELAQIKREVFESSK